MKYHKPETAEYVYEAPDRWKIRKEIWNQRLYNRELKWKTGTRVEYETKQQSKIRFIHPIVN
jgi:hypothetical protein